MGLLQRSRVTRTDAGNRTVNSKKIKNPSKDMRRTCPRVKEKIKNPTKDGRRTCPEMKENQEHLEGREKNLRPNQAKARNHPNAPQEHTRSRYSGKQKAGNARLAPSERRGRRRPRSLRWWTPPRDAASHSSSGCAQEKGHRRTRWRGEKGVGCPNSSMLRRATTHAKKERERER